MRTYKTKSKAAQQTWLKGSNVRPPAQQIMIDARELNYRRIIGLFAAYLLNSHVKVEKQCALSVITHHALHPEK